MQPKRPSKFIQNDSKIDPGIPKKRAWSPSDPLLGRLRNLFRLEILLKTVLRSPWGPSWASLAAFWAALGSIWAHPGPSWRVFGDSRGTFSHGIVAFRLRKHFV